MLISHQKQFIFIHIQKTAGQSITQKLKDNAPDVRKLNIHRKHDYATAGREILGLEQWNEYYKFAFVRNPWERLVSWYSMVQGICLDRKMSQSYSPYDLWSRLRKEYKKYQYLNKPSPNQLYAYILRNGDAFEDYIINSDRDNHKTMINQLDYLTDEKGEVIVDFIGRFESLADDFQTITNHLNLKIDKLPHITHKSKHKKYQVYYNDKTREIVRKRFAKDIDFFGYSFD